MVLIIWPAAGRPTRPKSWRKTAVANTISYKNIPEKLTGVGCVEFIRKARPGAYANRLLAKSENQLHRATTFWAVARPTSFKFPPRYSGHFRASSSSGSGHIAQSPGVHRADPQQPPLASPIQSRSTTTPGTYCLLVASPDACAERLFLGKRVMM